MAKSKTQKVVKHESAPVFVSPLHDLVIAATFADVETAGVAAEYLVKDVLGEYGKKLGTVISVTPQDYKKLANFRGCRVDVLCRTDNNELWLIEFQMYDDEFMFERNLTEVAYTIISSSTAGTTVEELAEAMPHIIVLNFLNFYIRNTDSEWLQPVHFTYDKAPKEVASDKLEIFNIQLPWFASHEPDFDVDGECWLYVMYQAHVKKTTPQEVLQMDTRLQRFAKTNPGFQQFETRFAQAVADSDLLDVLRMEASERIRQAGMKRAIEKKKAKAIALNLLAMNLSIDNIAGATGLTADEVRNLQDKA
jgi:predicted transposase/invertase (TIGR01784 family)